MKTRDLIRYRFIYWRAEMNLTQENLADKLRVSRMTISNIESGRQGVQDRIMDKFLSIINKSYLEFLDHELDHESIIQQEKKKEAARKDIKELQAKIRDIKKTLLT